MGFDLNAAAGLGPYSGRARRLPVYVLARPMATDGAETSLDVKDPRTWTGFAEPETVRGRIYAARSAYWPGGLEGLKILS